MHVQAITYSDNRQVGSLIGGDLGLIVCKFQSAFDLDCGIICCELYGRVEFQLSFEASDINVQPMWYQA